MGGTEKRRPRERGNVWSFSRRRAAPVDAPQCEIYRHDQDAEKQPTISAEAFWLCRFDLGRHRIIDNQFSWTGHKLRIGLWGIMAYLRSRSEERRVGKE